MTSHKGLPVSGYRAKSAEAVAVVNGNKILEECVLRQLDVLSLADDCDKRWLAIARTQIEQGFMAMNRAVFQPARVQLPGEEGQP